jgi:hypothetical protein
MKPSIPKLALVHIITFVAKDHDMVVIHVHIENLVDDVLLDGGFGVNIITKELKATLGLPKA